MQSKHSSTRACSNIRVYYNRDLKKLTNELTIKNPELPRTSNRTSNCTSNRRAPAHQFAHQTPQNPHIERLAHNRNDCSVYIYIYMCFDTDFGGGYAPGVCAVYIYAIWDRKRHLAVDFTISQGRGVYAHGHIYR